jgi:hypothetical protein
MHAFVATILKAAGRRRMTLKNARICGHLLNQILARLQTISQTNWMFFKNLPMIENLILTFRFSRNNLQG